LLAITLAVLLTPKLLQAVSYPTAPGPSPCILHPRLGRPRRRKITSCVFRASERSFYCTEVPSNLQRYPAWRRNSLVPKPLWGKARPGTVSMPAFSNNRGPYGIGKYSQPHHCNRWIGIKRI